MKKNPSSAIKILLVASIFYGCQKENVTHNDYKQETDKIETSIASGLTKDKSYITRQTISSIEAMLSDNEFIRIHRSFIISVNKIESYTAEMVEVNSVFIPIGRGYRDILEKL